MEQGYTDYPQYIKTHTDAVRNAFYYLKDIGAFSGMADAEIKKCERMVGKHDHSKYGDDEWDAYDAYFYGKSRSFEVVENFKRAWLHHIHENKHHWQHWVLIGDDKGEGLEAIEIPDCYIMEMVCDWFSFSLMNHNIENILNWYAEHRDTIIMHERTRRKVEDILDVIDRHRSDSI